MIKDFSLHFTIKDQDLEEIKKAFTYATVHSFDSVDTVLHHCFLPLEEVIANKYSTGVVDFLSICAEYQVCWKNTTNDLASSRFLMLQTVGRAGGTAFFVGALKHGVLEEYEIAKHVGMEVVHIPLIS